MYELDMLSTILDLSGKTKYPQLQLLREIERLEALVVHFKEKYESSEAELHDTREQLYNLEDELLEGAPE